MPFCILNSVFQIVKNWHSVFVSYVFLCGKIELVCICFKNPNILKKSYLIHWKLKHVVNKFVIVNNILDLFKSLDGKKIKVEQASRPSLESGSQRRPPPISRGRGYSRILKCGRKESSRARSHPSREENLGNFT